MAYFIVDSSRIGYLKYIIEKHLVLNEQNGPSMDISSFLNTGIYTWVVLPLLIFLARVCDQTIGTIRIMFISRGDKLISPILGFFEVLIWILAIREIMYNLSNVLGYVAYAGGFATGNLVGIYLEEKIALGVRVIRIITQQDASALAASLIKKGYGVTNIPAEGSQGEVNVIFTMIHRYDLEEVIKLVERFNPKAFYTIESVISVKEGMFPAKRSVFWRFFSKPPRFCRRIRILKRQQMSRKGK